MKIKLGNTFKTIAIRDEIQAMTIICNIQAMQNVIYGKSFEYADFSANTIAELYNLQNSLIEEYNNAVITKVN